MALRVESVEFEELASDPASPVDGQAWYNTTEDKHKLRAGGATINVPTPKMFDAIVAPSGADYTSVYDAFNAGHKTVYVRTGTYIETNTIVIPDTGQLTGEQGAIINFNGGAYRVECDGSGGVQETAGTISVGTNSTSVTGVGTTFTNLSPGDQLKIGPSWFEIDTITNNTNMDLLHAWRGDAVSGAPMLAQSMHRCVLINNIRVINSAVSGIYLRGILGLKLSCVNVFNCTGSNVELRNCYGANLEQCISKNSDADGYLIVDCDEISLDGYCHGDNNEEHGLHVEGTGDDVKVAQSSFTSNTLGGVFVNSTVRSCSLTSVVASYNDGKGIETGPNTGTTSIRGCVSEYNGGVGIDWDGEDNSIVACTIQNNGAGGMLGGNDGTIVANHIEDNTGVGINLSSGDSGSAFCSNHITGNTGDGVTCAGDNNIFSNNQIRSNGGNGVDLTSLASGNRFVNNTISGNTLTDYVDAGTNNVRVEDRIEAAIHDDVAAEISAITEKTTPVSADLLLIEDSAASNAKRRIQIGNLPYGDVTAASNISDNAIVRGDGGAKGIQESSWDIADSGDLEGNNNDITEVSTVRFNSEYDNGNSGTTKTVNWNNGQKQKLTMTANCTVTLTAPASGVGNFLLRTVQDATGGWDITWPASVKWPEGSAPELSEDASAIDIISFYYDGTNYYGVASLDFS